MGNRMSYPIPIIGRPMSVLYRKMAGLRYFPAILTLFLAGCCTTTVEPDFPCPTRPELMPLPVDLQIQMPPDAVWIVAENQLALKAHILKLEERANCGEN